MASFRLHRAADGRLLAVTVPGLLSEPERRRLLAAILAEERWFVEASTEGIRPHRRGAVLYTIVDEALWVVDRVARLAREHAPRWDLSLPDHPRMEHQITAYRDGDHYLPHRDDEGSEASARALTYVYHLHRVPRSYGGGELILHHAGEETVIVPDNGAVVLFPSGLLHEVRPVTSESSALAASRFSVNGWLWR